MPEFQLSYPWNPPPYPKWVANRGVVCLIAKWLFKIPAKSAVWRCENVFAQKKSVPRRWSHRSARAASRQGSRTLSRSRSAPAPASRSRETRLRGQASNYQIDRINQINHSTPPPPVCACDCDSTPPPRTPVWSHVCVRRQISHMISLTHYGVGSNKINPHFL